MGGKENGWLGRFFPIKIPPIRGNRGEGKQLLAGLESEQRPVLNGGCQFENVDRATVACRTHVQTITYGDDVANVDEGEGAGVSVRNREDLCEGEAVGTNIKETNLKICLRSCDQEVASGVKVTMGCGYTKLCRNGAIVDELIGRPGISRTGNRKISLSQLT